MIESKVSDLDPISRQLVQSIVNQINRPTGVVDGATVLISARLMGFYANCAPKQRLKCHETLKPLELNGLIQCSWHPNVLDEFETLQSIIIPSGKAFLKTFDVQPHAMVVTNANKRLLALKCGVDWIDAKIVDIIERWRMGARYLLLGPEHIDEVAIAAKTAYKLSSQAINGRDMWALSYDWFGGREILERHAKIIALFCESQIHNKAKDLEPIDQLANLGISMQAPLMHLQGPVVAKCENGVDIEVGVWPRIGLVKDAIKYLELTSPPAYVLTIENYITYQRFTNEINDNAIIIYTGDFPSRKFLELYSGLIEKTAPETPIFHWGDIDLAGFRCAMALNDELFTREVRPFQMCAEWVEQGTVEAPPLNAQKLRKMLYASSGCLKQTLTELVALPENSLREVKQESMDITPPVDIVNESVSTQAKP